jgi:hypothetical protein
MTDSDSSRIKFRIRCGKYFQKENGHIEAKSVAVGSWNPRRENEFLRVFEIPSSMVIPILLGMRLYLVLYIGT